MRRYVKLREWPPDHAYTAYRRKYFIEAIQTLHSWLECKLRELLNMSSLYRLKGADEDGWIRAWDLSNEFSLNNAAKALFIIGSLSEAELSRIVEFNRVRNNIIHKLFWDPHNEKWNGVPKSEYDRAFKEGMKLCAKIELRTAMIDTKNDGLSKKLRS